MGRYNRTEVVCREDLQLPGSPISLDKRLKDTGSACNVKSIALQELLSSSKTTNDVFSENGRERVGS